MVNEISKTKHSILKMLRDSRETLSGQQMSENLKISRVAVWKNIKSLRDMGYSIEGTASGYILTDDKDLLYSWEFKGVGDNYHTYRELTSTMDIARIEAEKGCDEFTTIIAEKQSAGRGRGEKQWLSNEGGLYFTTVLKPRLPMAYHYIYTLAAAVVLNDTVKEIYNIPLSVKWPNDLLYNNRKLAGILTEFHVLGDRLKWLNLGIGINVNNSIDNDMRCSIREISGSIQDRKILLSSFEGKYKKLIDNNSPSEIRSLWKRDNFTLKKDIRLKTSSGQVFNGIAEDIDATGALLIRGNNNIKTQALFGDIYE